MEVLNADSDLRALARSAKRSYNPTPSPPGTHIGHVHLKVADLERALDFYHGVLGFELVTRYGTQAAFVAAGGYHHHIGLKTLAAAVRHILDAGVRLQGASDHGVSEAVYLADPDQNGLELYWDRPRERWPRTADGSVEIFTRPLDLEDLLREAAG